MERQTRSNAINCLVTQKIYDFFLSPEISRTMPSKRDVIRVRVAPNEYEEVPKQILEHTLTEAYRLFKTRYPEIAIGQRSFEKRRPVQVIPAKVNHRLVCGCIYHFRAHYLLQAVNATLKMLSIETKFATITELMDFTLCPPPSDGQQNINCIERNCKVCGVHKIDNLLSHDSTTCRCNQEADGSKVCAKPIKWKGYEYTEDSDEGCHKKKLALVDKIGSLTEFASDVHQKLDPFAKHRFTAYWTYHAYKQLVNNLPYSHCIFILDFAENYACKIYREIQSLHLVSVQATLFIIVIIRHSRPEIDGNRDVLVEDQFIMISDDTIHDVWSVQHGRKLAIKWMDEKLLWRPTKIWDISDGAASQFKCSTSFLHISTHAEDFNGIEVEHMYWETAHGKGKADGVGGVVKHKASMAVVKKEETIRNAKELYEYCARNLESVGTSSTYASRERAGITVHREFVYVPKQGPNSIQRPKPGSFKKPKTIPGTRSLHCVKGAGKGYVMTRKYPCMCDPCIDNGTKSV